MYLNRVLAFLSDFGLKDPYVGQVEAVLAAESRAQVVNLMHNIPPQHVDLAAHIVDGTLALVPAGSVILAVVDPGVGGDRLPLVVKASNKWFVGPGNGLFEGVLRVGSESAEVWEVTWRPEILSNSFHGRDLFAPVAAMLHCGNEPPGEPRILDWNRYIDWPDSLFRIAGKSPIRSRDRNLLERSCH
mgnify:CR=1 FL=1